MADGIQEIITQLEQKRRAIDNALAALQGLSGSNPSGERRARTGSRAAAAKPSDKPAPAKSAPARRGGLTTAGRKRLAEAMKKRWAVKRAGSTVKKAAKATRKES